MELPFVITTLARRGVLTPGNPMRVAAQLDSLRRWGFGLAGELRQAAARDPDRVALIDDADREVTYRELLTHAEGLPGRCVPRTVSPPTTQLRVLLHDREFSEQLLAVPADVVRVDATRYAELSPSAPATATALGPPEREGRTIVLTSGTTGTGKVVARELPRPAGF
ncbi:hypothetical protein O7632_01780 [Solwaraspora sp. WMMD406]|uniref:hypothetical protein n=1 Tax=Solwaraspora sp. WMMD406 TaxID=3016095 RepID=UPI002416A8CF|nr:hypothetical protein [Solwaraspora sp. WMMD406]MDG4762851.1 hypothetical protein [Solwaraspora sp. WMMD406]